MNIFTITINNSILQSKKLGHMLRSNELVSLDLLKKYS